MIRLLFVAHDSSLFGAQRSLLTILQGIDRSRFDCRVVAPAEGPFVDEVRQLDIPVDIRATVRWVPESRVLVAEGRLNYMVRFLAGLRGRSWAIAALIERHRIDLVYTNSVVAVEGAIAARMARIPHIWHILEPTTKNPELGAVFPQWFYPRAINALSRQVIYCSRSLAAAFPLLATKSTVVLNGLPLPAAVNRASARATLAEKFSLSAGTRVVAIVGAIQPRKDHATFLRAASKIVATRRDVAFFVVGSGNAERTAMLHQQIDELQLSHAVRVVGWWPGSIHEFVAAADVLAISSIQESFGLTAIEALAVETPVVATRCGGPDEILRDGVDSLLVPVGDSQALAIAIGSLLDDPQLARRFGETGRRHVSTALSVERFVSTVQGIIAETALAG